MSARSEKLLDLIDEHGRSNIGYSQGRRWTWLNKSARSIIRGKAGDCSSVTIGLIWLAGYPVDSKWIAGSLSAYTGNAYQILTAAGLKARKVSGLTPAQINALTKPGDSLLKSGHIMIKARGGKWYTMTSDENGRLTGGADGDQTGRESVLSNLWSDSWTWIFVLPDHGADDGGVVVEPEPNAQQSAPTPAPGLTGGVTLVENPKTNVRTGPSTSYDVVGTLGPNTQVTGVLVGTWVKLVTPSQYVDQYVSGAVLYDLKTTPAVSDDRPDVSTIVSATDPLLTSNPIDALNVSAEFAAALTSRWARRVSIASLWLEGRMIVDELPLVADESKISVSSDGPIRRRADLTFSTGRFESRPVRDLLELPGVTIRVETGFDLGGRIETVPVFESSPAFSVGTADGSGTVKVDAPDRMEMVSSYGFNTPTFSNPAASFQAMIFAVIQEASPGARLVDLTGSSELLPELYWDAGQTARVEAVMKLAEALGAELFKSPVPGVWVMRPFIAPGESTPKWHVRAGRNLVSSNRTIDKGRICNHVVVESERADTPMQRGQWQDIDPDSATRYGGPMGRRMAPVVRTSMWSEEDDLMAFAAAIGARRKGTLLDLDWSMLINPLMEAGDPVEVETPDFTYSCVLDSFEIPLGSQRVSSGKARALKVPGVDAA